VDADPAKTSPSSVTQTLAFVPSVFSVMTSSRRRRAARALFKMTLEKDEAPKGQVG